MTKEGDIQSAIRQLWSFFSRNSTSLQTIKSAADSLYDALLARVRDIHNGLGVEVSVGKSPKELIITTHGKRELFDLARQVVNKAPATKGWAFLALKPRLGFPETAQWEDFLVRLAEMAYEPYTSDETPGLAIRIFIPGLKQEHFDKAHDALVVALDHGLGEECFAESIVEIDVAPLPEGKSLDDYLCITRLDEYIDRLRAKKIL